MVWFFPMKYIRNALNKWAAFRKHHKMSKKNLKTIELPPPCKFWSIVMNIYDTINTNININKIQTLYNRKIKKNTLKQVLKGRLIMNVEG